MIRFVCNCGNRLEVPEDQAGDSLQCPKCGLLVDVPTLSELQHFTEDGTYRMDTGGPVATDSDRMADLGIIYSKTKLDDDGNEIDLRTIPAGRKHPRSSNFHDQDDDDQGELELKPAGDTKPAVTERPKYDPETGELIRPLDIRNDPGQPTDPSSIPMAKPAIQYAGVDISKRISPLKVAAELLMPVNVIVMCIVLVAHLFNGILFVTTAGLFFLIPVLLIYQGLLVSHYGNVIDETGRNEHDDLPRPLRNLEFHDDLWGPFVAMFGGLMIAFVVPLYILVYIAQRTGIPVWMMWLLGGIIGTVLAPAVLLTTNTSGSTLNLRPDRVLKVIKICGVHYLGVTLLWAVTWPIYAVGWIGFCFALLREFIGVNSRSTGPLVNWMIVLPALLAGIYLMHYFCWYLGLLYRAHHPEFPWVFQRYIRDPDKARPARTHADQLGRRRPVSGHLPPLPPTPPPAPPPPSATSRIG